MESAIKHDDGSVRAALRAQLAVAVEILLMAPIRLSNLASLEIGRSYIRSRRNGSYKAHIVFEAEEVKNSMPLKFDLPEESVRLIDLYLVRFHRRTVRSSAFLFPGRSGSKDTASLSAQVSTRLFKVLGLRINVHLFRHMAAKIYLDRHPHAFEFVRQLLGHKNIQTTMKFYAQFSRTSAAQHYDNVVLGLRAGDQQGMPQ
jgi:integrase